MASRDPSPKMQGNGYVAAPFTISSPRKMEGEEGRLNNVQEQVNDTNYYTVETPRKPPRREWADVVSAGNMTGLGFNEAGYMSQASSVMEMDQDSKPLLNYNTNPQWEWVDHFEDGMVFVCTSGTFEESCKRMLLGLPKQYMVHLKTMSNRSHIFLFNKSTKLMHAGYHPGGEADWNICPQAFTPVRRDENGNEKRQPPGSKYPAQIPFAVFRHLEPLPEAAFKGVLKDPRKPKRLKRAHVRQLLRIFQKAAAPAAAVTPGPPAAFIKITTPTGSDGEPAATHSREPSNTNLNNIVHFLTPPMNNNNGRVSPAASTGSNISPAPSVAFSGSHTPTPQPFYAPIPQITNVSIVPIKMPDTQGDANQKFKMRSTDALKRLQNGNIRPVNHLFASMHDQITTLQAQLQQQQLIINNLSYQLTQVQLQRMVPIYPSPSHGDCNSNGAMSPQSVLSPSGNSPPMGPRIIPVTFPAQPIPIRPMSHIQAHQVRSPTSFNVQSPPSQHRPMQGYFPSNHYHQPCPPTFRG